MNDQDLLRYTFHSTILNCNKTALGEQVNHRTKETRCTKIHTINCIVYTYMYMFDFYENFAIRISKHKFKTTLIITFKKS